MLEAEVLVLSRWRREQVAQDLIAWGVTLDQVRDLCAKVHEAPRAVVKDPGGFINFLLSDRGRCTAALEDLAVARAAQARRQREAEERAAVETLANEQPRPLQPGESMRIKEARPLNGEDAEQWRQERRRRMAFCLVVGDRRSVEDVARELEVTVERVVDLVAEERAQRSAS